jgi:endonuclease/exonuclease/phosphatase family metal-dependent hydrolase
MQRAPRAECQRSCAAGAPHDDLSSMRIATFNVQNLRLRHVGGTDRLDGARDGDEAENEALDPVDRRLTAAVIRDLGADVVALQEVFDAGTLDHFHDRVLLPARVAAFPYRVCLPGNDGRGLDVAVMSRVPLGDVTSHAALRAADLGLDAPEAICDQPVFRRDCLAVQVGPLTLFVCHFKAPWPDAAASWPVRRLEAEAVRRIIEGRFDDPAKALWLIAGDLNDPDPPASPGRAIAPLARPFAVDLAARMPESERWSLHDPGSGLRFLPDALLASPQLAESWPNAVPAVLREGLSREAGPGPRLREVGEHRPHASDHAAMVVEFPGLA